MASLVHVRCPITGRPLQLRRAWPRGPDRLLLEYVDHQRRPGARGGAVAGQWLADRGRLAAVAHQTAAAAGSPGTVATLDDLGVVLQRDGADRRLGALAGVLADPRATLVVHRPERRAVVRLTGPRSTTYVKVVRPGRLPVALPASARIRTPAVMGRNEAEGTIEYGELAGTSFYDLLTDRTAADAVVVRAARATGDALRRLHATAMPGPMAFHGAEAEIGVVERWLDYALAYAAFPRAGAGLARAVLARTVALLEAQPVPVTTGLVHRDLHDKQVLISAGGAGILDLDTLAEGDPALDLANLVVHLELRALQGGCSRRRAAQAAGALVEGYRLDPVLRARLGAYCAATRLRLACVYAFRPRWSAVAHRLLVPNRALGLDQGSSVTRR